jgi:hypothetical protein
MRIGMVAIEVLGSGISGLAIASMLAISCGGKSQDITYVVVGGRDGASGSGPRGEGEANAVGGSSSSVNSGGASDQANGSGGAEDSGEGGSPGAAGEGSAGTPSAGGEGGAEPTSGEGGGSGSDCGEGCFLDQDGGCDCPLIDETTQLMWQDPPKLDQTFNVYGGANYCTGLIFAGRGDWRLPTIDELRTLIRGCAQTSTGGACPVTNASPSSDALVEACGGCGDEEGPGHYFEFWDPMLTGESYYSEYFSSTSPAGDSGAAWYVDFLTGKIALDGKDYGKRVRCVRTID